MAELPGPTDAPSEPVQIPGALLSALMAQARSMAPAAAATAADATVIQLVGRATPGPGGPLRAPLSGRECVWYRSVVFYELQGSYGVDSTLVPINDFKRSDTGFAHLPDSSGPDLTSQVPFTITDGTGAIVVDPRAGDIDSNVFAINTVVTAGKRDTAGIGPLQFRTGPHTGRELHTEWIIPVGAEITAYGAVTHAGAGEAQLTAPDGAAVFVSTRSQQRIAIHASVPTIRGPVDPTRIRIYVFGGFAAILVIVLVIVLTTVHH